MLPFTHSEFLQVFAHYNLAVWPAQVFAYALAACMLAGLAFAPTPWKGRAVAGGLAAMWLWTGIAYHWIEFAAINKAAWVFGALFVLQAALFTHAAIKARLECETGGTRSSRVIGWALIAYASVLYPVIGLAFGPGYPQVRCSRSRPARSPCSRSESCCSAVRGSRAGCS
jgi:hypothetical protein